MCYRYRMQPRWETLVAVLALGGSACSMQQAQQTVVVVHIEPPTGARPGGVISLGEGPGDLTAAQINAALAGQGTWSDSPAYGRVWRPDERLLSLGGAGFSPYVTGGQWLATDGGWYWQSDYAWGRVAFHYGRWVLDGSTWWWVPGSRFAPAWVDWRAGNGWVAWSPMTPRRARAWSPFVYCAQGSLVGAGLPGRVVQGAAASSLYARTSTVEADGDTPRGPSIDARLVSVVPMLRAWQGAPVALRSSPSALMAAAEPGVESVSPIPEALLDAPAPEVIEASRGGPVARITDRDLVGMSAGPSVRRGVVPESVLPDRVPEVRATTVVIPAPEPAPRVASVAPPPLPPPPDGVASGPWFGGYPMRGPAGFAPRRGTATPAGFGAPAVVVAPSQAPAAPAASTGSVMATGGGGWRGGYRPAPSLSGPAGLTRR